MTSKLAAILRTFASGSEHSLSDIARSANLPISTAHRLAMELAEWGILERTDHKRYRVGTLLAHVGGQVWHEPNLSERARRVVEDLCSATRTTVRLGVLDALAVSYIEKQPNTRPASMCYEAEALPAHATAMGKALLAFSPVEMVDAVIDKGLEEYTPFTIVSAPVLRRALAITHMTGVATARREFHLNTGGVAAPVFGTGGHVVAALELVAENSIDQLRLVQSAVVVAASALSRELISSRRRAQLGKLVAVHGAPLSMPTTGSTIDGTSERSGTRTAG